MELLSLQTSTSPTDKANLKKRQLQTTINGFHCDDTAAVHGNGAAVQELVRCEHLCDGRHEPPRATATQTISVIVPSNPVQALHGYNMLDDATHREDPWSEQLESL